MIAVLFEANALPEAQERYLQLASELKPLLADTPGFISIERFQSLTTPGKILSLSWWKDEESVAGKTVCVPGMRELLPTKHWVAIIPASFQNMSLCLKTGL